MQLLCPPYATALSTYATETRPMNDLFLRAVDGWGGLSFCLIHQVG